MAGTYFNDAGTWRTIQSVHFNDAGTWRKLQQIWFNDAGTWRLVYAAFSPTQYTFTSGSGTVTIPTGATTLTIELVAGGGGSSDSGYTASYAAGAGGGSYCRSVYTVSSAWGQTINYSVGPPGSHNINNNGLNGQPCTATSGTFTITAMTANGGGGAAANGAGGTATGGNAVNATGSTGTNLGAGGLAPNDGVYISVGSTYGKGGDYNTDNQTGGIASFYFT